MNLAAFRKPNQKIEISHHQTRYNQPIGYSVLVHSFHTTFSFQSSKFKIQIQEMSSQFSSKISSSLINNKKLSLEALRVFELKEIATGLNIKGRSIMRKQDLVDAILSNWIKEQENIHNSGLEIPVRLEKTLHICRGLTIQGKNLVNCQNKSDKQHCHEHEHRYRFEKPDDCPVCMDSISSKTETPLECGHWVHKQCLVPTNLHICPVCRQGMKQHEVNFIFGENHQQHNQYSHGYYQPFADESLFSLQVIFQGANGSRVIQIEDYNNQEHFFNEVQSEYLFEDENHNGLEFHNDFDEHEDNFYHNEQRIIQQENEEVEVQNPFVENSFSNMPYHFIEWIVQEIETRPRNNPYVTLPNDMSEIPNNLRRNFIDFVDRLIHNFGDFNNFIIDEIMTDEIRAQLFEIEADRNLLGIYFNLTFVPHINVDFLMRIQTLVNNRIREVHDILTFNF